MGTAPQARPAEILLVEDNPGDVELTQIALEQSKLHVNLHVVADGEQALVRLRGGGPRPDLILLDLNLPGKSGPEVLAEIKADPQLRVIPVVILTSSRAEEDVLRSYRLHANCYVPKPVDFAGFAQVVQSIEGFWFSVVVLPPQATS
jgi:two-component system response regulator